LEGTVVSTIDELRGLLADLSPFRLAELRDFAEFLREKDRVPAPVVLDDLFGALSPEKAAAMEQAINDGCEQIDAATW
jgi:hypothetical protein